MKDLKVVSVTGETQSHFDIEISNGDFIKTDSFAQRVLLSLNTWFSEFVYQQTTGVDYMAVLKDTKISSSRIESFILSSLLKDLEDFETLEDFELKFDENTQIASISFVAYSKTGQSAKVKNKEL